MKRFLFFISALAALTLSGSCSREVADVSPEGDFINATFHLSLPGDMATKAISDGTQAKDLYVAVYANRTEGPVYMESLSTADQPDAFANGLTTTVKFRLVRGENYNIAFWAQAPNAPYTLDKAAGTLTVNTEGVANDEIRDAFYCVWSGTPTAEPQDVELRRPFAQINVLTTVEDWAALQLTQIPFAGSSAKVTAPSVLNLITGEATAPKEYDLTFGAIDPEAINIPGYESAYKYVAMNYVLAGTRSTTDLSFSVYRAEQDPLASFDVPNIPYQRNWRTIVWGDIFTMEGEFNVTIDPAYEDGVDWPMDGIAQTLSLVPGSALAAAAQQGTAGAWTISLKKDAKLDFTGIESDATGATADYKSSDPEVGGFITNTAGEFTALKAGETTVTVTFTADGCKPAAMTFVVTVTEDEPISGAVTDVIDNAFTGVSGNNYVGWDGISGSASDAIYAGNTAGDHSSVQMRSNNNNSGIVSTKSGGILSKVEITWNSNTAADREVQIYGSTTAYSSAADLYNANTQGTLLGSIKNGENTTSLTVTGNYTYVGIRSKSGALYLDEIKITWIVGTTPTLYWIDPITPDNGTLEIDANEPWEFAEGPPIKVIATPATNYELSELYYTDENDGHKTDIDKQTLTFDMPGFNVLVYATFTEKTVQPTLYTVEFGDMEHGSVSLATPANGFAAGETVTLSVVPDDNYELDEETLTYNTEGVDDRNPITKDATGAYSFTMPASNVTVYARFEEKTVQPNDGSQAHPFTVAEVRDFIDGLKGAVSENEVYVAGKIASIANNGQFSASFGNASFFISDDGQTTSDQFEAYRVLYLGNKKWVEGDATVAVGDEVIICGKVKLYSPSNGDPVYETHQSNADNYNGYLYSLNGQTEIVNNTPVITADNISGIPAAGVTNATAPVTITNIDNSWTVTATCDGTVVTDASWANNVLTYTVAANTDAARSGKVTISVIKDNKEYSKEITVSQLAGTVELGEYDSNVSWLKGTSCYDDNKITVNGIENVANLKFGTSSKFGDATITLPSGTTKVTFYAVAWKDTPANLKFTVGTKEYNFDVAPCAGATGSTQPYALTASDTDKKTLTLDAALTEDTTIKVETSAGETNSGKRAFLFGVKAVK